MMTGTLTARELYGFAIRREMREDWPHGQAIARDGWDGEELALILRPGGVTRLNEGNHRVSWLVQHGDPDTQIPIRLAIQLAPMPARH